MENWLCFLSQSTPNKVQKEKMYNYIKIFYILLLSESYAVSIKFGDNEQYSKVQKKIQNRSRVNTASTKIRCKIRRHGGESILC